MMFRNRISLFVATFLIIGFFFLALPEKGITGIPNVPGGPPCCGIGEGNLCVGGEGAIAACELPGCGDIVSCELFENSTCVVDDDKMGICVSPPNVPTLSEWGLIAMAAILGIVGFMVMRRRKAVA